MLHSDQFWGLSGSIVFPLEASPTSTGASRFPAHKEKSNPTRVCVSWPGFITLPLSQILTGRDGRLTSEQSRRYNTNAWNNPYPMKRSGAAQLSSSCCAEGLSPARQRDQQRQKLKVIFHRCCSFPAETEWPAGRGWGGGGGALLLSWRFSWHPLTCRLTFPCSSSDTQQTGQSRIQRNINMTKHPF